MPAPSNDTENVEVTMVRDHLHGFPMYRLPNGYRMRPYRNGDGAAWTDLHRAAEPYIDVTPDLFLHEYGAALDALDDRMYFVETVDGQLVASITAWWEHAQDRPHTRGRIHWVVVHPEYQGRGIAKAMMTHAMTRLAESHHSAMLGTATGRPAAIKIYLDFGFLPDPHELDQAEMLAAWRRVQTSLDHPALGAFLASRTDGHAQC